MKPARKPEAALCFLREFLRCLKTCFNSAKPMLSSDENGKGVRRRGERLSKSSWRLAHKAVLHRSFMVWSQLLVAQVY